MSYRAVWCRIKATEERLHCKLLIRSNSGSTLTPFALKLLKQFRRLQAVIQTESDAMFQELMADSMHTPLDAEERTTEGGD